MPLREWWLDMADIVRPVKYVNHKISRTPGLNLFDETATVKDCFSPASTLCPFQLANPKINAPLPPGLEQTAPKRRLSVDFNFSFPDGAMTPDGNEGFQIGLSLTTQVAKAANAPASLKYPMTPDRMYMMTFLYAYNAGTLISTVASQDIHLDNEGYGRSYLTGTPDGDTYYPNKGMFYSNGNTNVSLKPSTWYTLEASYYSYPYFLIVMKIKSNNGTKTEVVHTLPAMPELGYATGTSSAKDLGDLDIDFGYSLNIKTAAPMIEHCIIDVKNLAVSGSNRFNGVKLASGLNLVTEYRGFDAVFNAGQGIYYKTMPAGFDDDTFTTCQRVRVFAYKGSPLGMNLLPGVDLSNPANFAPSKVEDLYVRFELGSSNDKRATYIQYDPTGDVTEPGTYEYTQKNGASVRDLKHFRYITDRNATYNGLAVNWDLPSNVPVFPVSIYFTFAEGPA